MHQTSLHETAQRPPSPWPVPTLRASVPASTVQCRWEKPADAGNKRAWFPSADRVLGMCSVQTSPAFMCRGSGQLLEQPCGLWSKLGSSHKQVSTSLQQLAVALRGGTA
jgi:hypothetical protein